jgi:hypothetical protein
MDIDNKTKVIIICKKHGEFSQLPNNHLKYECNWCGHESASEVRKLPLKEFIERANKIHDNKYDYSKVDYTNRTSKITIICKKHGEFQQIVGKHLDGRGCQQCNLCPKCYLWRTYGNICQYCRPLNQNKLYMKTKEMAVVKFLKDNLPDHDFIHNKSVGNDCTGGHLFPDIRFDCDFYQLIIEVDEHKHRGANYKCDRQRMYDIIAKLGMPCIFIRYNPDHKRSDKNILLKRTKYYLNLEENDCVWDDYGIKVEYLFY